MFDKSYTKRQIFKQKVICISLWFHILLYFYPVLGIRTNLFALCLRAYYVNPESLLRNFHELYFAKHCLLISSRNSTWISLACNERCRNKNKRSGPECSQNCLIMRGFHNNSSSLVCLTTRYSYSVILFEFFQSRI